MSSEHEQRDHGHEHHEHEHHEHPGHDGDAGHEFGDLKVLRDAAADAYGTLKTYFLASDNYWRLGCTFDTLTDALRILGPSRDTSLAKDALTQYHNTSGAWYDDYAWWAIASAKAYDPAFAQIFGSFANSFTGIAQGCWSYVDQGLNDGVHNGAPQVFVNRDNESFFLNPPSVPFYWAEPRFDNGRGSGLHGVWQKDMFANARIVGDGNWFGPTEFGPNPSVPSVTNLGPYQNTVVNGLYLLAAVRFEQARLTNRAVPTCAAQAADEYGFVRTWMGYNPAHPLQPVETLLNTEFGDGTAVVRERVSTYAFHNGGYPRVENWDARTSWGGDQGLLINGLAGYFQLSPVNTEIPGIIRSLMLGYARHVVDANGVPQPYFPITDNKLASWDPDDYESGVGVFMRGLVQAARIADGPVRAFSRTPEFQQFLRRAVAWATNAPPPDDMFAALNVLATLLAGIELLTPSE